MLRFFFLISISFLINIENCLSQDLDIFFIKLKEAENETIAKEYEEKINLEYLEKICSAYSEFFFSYSESPLLVLNVDDVDFVSNQMDFNQIIDCVKKNIIGREFINLSPSFF